MAYGKMCNDCWLSMQNCKDMSICCEMEEYEGDRCHWFEPIPEDKRTRMNETQKILIKYHADINRIQPISVGDWIDLRSAETVELRAGEYKALSLGVSIQLPKGYEALVVPRSSTFRRYGIVMVNSIGVIDESYCGDNDIWQFPAFAVTDTVIPKNERICQFRIIKHQPEIELATVETFGNEDRGGIGSTGRR